jgi:hypothetical protein
MNKEKLLKKILETESLRTKYWPKIDISAQNINTLNATGNKYLKALHSLLDENAVKMNTVAIYKLFNII